MAAFKESLCLIIHNDVNVCVCTSVCIAKIACSMIQCSCAVKKSSFAMQFKVIKHAEHHSNRVVAIIIGVAMYMYMHVWFSSARHVCIWNLK